MHCIHPSIHMCVSAYHGIAWCVCVCVAYLSDGIDGSSAVDRELFVASVKQIHSECFTQTVLILTNNDDDDVMGKECGEEVLNDCNITQIKLNMHT